MSWFGETFGDSLNSLKGQITKITKEVLAEDAAAGSEKQEPEDPSLKELKALCESKDLEIAYLRDEFNKLHNRYQSEILSLNGSVETDPGKPVCDIGNVEKLENELAELRQERDHLNSCIDELQSEHQSNLTEVISLTDKYKSELEELKREYNVVKSKLDEALSNVGAESVKDAEVSLLNAQIKELQLEVEKEKEKSRGGDKNEIESQNSLKEQVDKLLNEVKEINNIRQKTEEDRERVQNENEELRKKLSLKVKENTEISVKLKVLTNEKEELSKKCQGLELLESKLSEVTGEKVEVEEKLENLLQFLNLRKESSVSEMITLIESNFQEKICEVSKDWKEIVRDLELQLKNLKEGNRNIQEKLKLSVERESEMERKHEQEIFLLKSSLSEMKTQEQDCMQQSQTDDVKRLEQEMAQCMSSILAKDQEITDYSKSLHKLEQELKDLKVSSMKIEEELEGTKREKKKLQEEIEKLKSFSLKMNQEKAELEEKQKLVEAQKAETDQINCQLISKSNELEKQITELTVGNERVRKMEEEMQKVTQSKADLEKKVEEVQNENLKLKNDFEYSKAQAIVKESSISELMKANMSFQEKVAELQAQYNALLDSEKEKEKWKDASINLQIQVEDLIEKKEEMENECLRLRSELEGLAAKDAEIQQLKLTNSNLMKSCNELHQQLELKTQEEDPSRAMENELEEKCKNQLEAISQLQEENNELKCRIQKFQQELKNCMLESKSLQVPRDEVQQHRRSKSAAESESHVLDAQGSETQNEQMTKLKGAIQQEQAKYQLLLHQFQEISSKEASARKEFERLKQHLLEVEDHYTGETVESEKIINDLKTKLVAAEEQLHNSSTLYTSLKVRDNQHLESLQSQIRMVSAQRDDFQSKLSTAEDEVQKHKASLMSLQMVLEQFQQDKEREIEQVAMRYEKQLQLADERFRHLESEMDGLRNQLTEAKNGLKAASRLGEQLEKKAKQVSELEEKESHFTIRIKELEQSLAVANQGNNGKVDKSLIKNLVVGYVLSPNAERKSQVLRIMASVLDFDQEEKDKMGVDANRSGWLSNILHPKGEGPPSSQSLSEAFIKFLENESRPQPQLKLLPEQAKPSASQVSKTTPKPAARLSELTLPTFNSPQENESSIILKNVLKDS